MYENEIYDISTAFANIENELIKSMMRNLDKHRAEETAEGMNWTSWQTKQLHALESYKVKNKDKFTKQFNEINNQIDTLINIARKAGNIDQELTFLKAIKKGRIFNMTDETMQGEFFKLNDRKMDALIKATTNDFKKGEYATLRQANDQYRKIIFNAQAYSNSGAATYEKAVDMATKDFLSRGITSIEYSNGARHTIADYSDMCLRTATKRAYLTGEGEMRMKWGEHLVIMNKRGNPCPLCAKWVGKILIDDVWSGGSASDGNYPLMSFAISQGLYHPRCRDSHTTYFDDGFDEEYNKEKGIGKYEQQKLVLEYNKEQRNNYKKKQVEKYDRLERYNLDKDNKKMYEEKKKAWKNINYKTGGMNSKDYSESKRPLANFKPLKKEKVIDIIHNESKEWISNLTDKEKHAIKKYTYNSGDKKPDRFFEVLNAMLRKERKESNQLREYANIISGAIKRSELKHDIICYRSIDKDIYKDKKVGSVFIEQQFVSTSIVESGAMNKPYRIIIYIKKGSKAGYVEDLSHYKKQHELLLDKGSIFRVLSKKDNMVELEVL